MVIFKFLLEKTANISKKTLLSLPMREAPRQGKGAPQQEKGAPRLAAPLPCNLAPTLLAAVELRIANSMGYKF